MPIYYTLARESPTSNRGAPSNPHEPACLPQVDFHLETTKLAAADHYAALRGPPFHSHVIHPGQIQNTIAGQQPPQPKGNFMFKLSSKVSQWCDTAHLCTYLFIYLTVLFPEKSHRVGSGLCLK